MSILRAHCKYYQNYNMVLGLDVSTTTIGISVLENTGKIVKLDYLSLKNTKEMFEKANLFREKIIEIVNEFPIERIAVEQALLGFMGGSSVEIRTMLCEFNAICRYVIYEEFNNTIPVTLISRQTVIAFIRKKMNFEIKGKEQKKQLAAHFYNANLYEFPLMKKAKRPIDESLDMIDAWSVALCLSSL